MRRSSEQVLLACLARAEVSSERRKQAAALVREGPDWEELTRLAVAHRVVPLLYHNLQALFPQDVSPAAMQRLRALFHAQFRCSMLLAGELPDLLALLGRRGIEAVPFKGPVLAAMAYPRRQLRPFTDLDLFVRKDDVEAAVAALCEAGYEEENPLPSDYDSQWTSYRPFQHPHGNANGYVKRTGAEAIAVDLHWGLASHYFLFPMAAEEPWTRLEPVVLENGQEVMTFSAEDTLLFLCMHAAKHGWDRLCYACDIAELIHARTELDWRWTLGKAEALRSERMLLLGLDVAETLLQAPLPHAVRQRMEARPEVSALSAEVQDSLFRPRDGFRGLYRTCAFHLRVRDRRRDGLGACWYHTRLTLQPTDEDRRWIDLPPALSFLYVLVRPVRIAFQTLLGRG